MADEGMGREGMGKITKLRRYRHRGTPPLCSHCLEKPSTGWTSYGNLGCMMCQNRVDVYISAHFIVEALTASL